jgi:hypothetical protein
MATSAGFHDMASVLALQSIHILKLQVKEDIPLFLIIVYKVILNGYPRIPEMEAGIILPIWCREDGIYIITVLTLVSEPIIN